jgi:hypothetical protein
MMDAIAVAVEKTEDLLGEVAVAADPTAYCASVYSLQGGQFEKALQISGHTQTIIFMPSQEVCDSPMPVPLYLLAALLQRL